MFDEPVKAVVKSELEEAIYPSRTIRHQNSGTTGSVFSVVWGSSNAPGPDAPAFERKDFSELTRQEKVHGLRVAAGRRAAQNDGRAQLDVAAVRRNVFEGQPTDGHTRDLMRAAERIDGFEFGKRHGKDRLRVDLREVTANSVLEAVGNTAAYERDVTPGVEPQRRAVHEPSMSVETEMDRITSATPATSDGGDKE